MGSNMQRLGKTLSARMRQTSASAVPTTMELGTVNSDYSITPDGLQAAIPKGDYMVNIMLTGSAKTSSETHTHSGGTHSGHSSGSGGHSHDGGEHSHEMPASYRGIKPGDRVLLTWCGNDLVVIAIVVSS